MEQIELNETELSNIRELIEKGRKVDAVMRVQTLTKAGLKNAKDFVDKMAEKLTDRN